MTKRPISITILSWFFIAAGCVALGYHLQPGRVAKGSHSELVWVCVVRFLLIICGVFMLRGCNWARWLLAIWLAYHVVLGALHSLSGFAIHALITAVVLYFLFRPRASAYFRAPKAEPAPSL